MLNIECDNPVLLKELTSLANDVLEKGGFFDKTLVLKVKDGNFGLITTRPGGDQALLMKIPENLYIPFGQVKFKLDNNKLVVTDWGKELDDFKKSMLEKIIKIYNLTNKISTYKENNPRVVFKDDPEFLKRICAARQDTNIVKNTLEILETDDLDQFVITNFFRTRNFTSRSSKQNLIPFIDFTNHHTMAQSFQRQQGPGAPGSMSLIGVTVKEGDNQVFARYGNWDNFDTYIMFGFAQEPVPFVRSVPLEFKYDGDKVMKLEAEVGGTFRGNLPDELKDLKQHFPRVKGFEQNLRHFSSLSIPGPHTPRALKRILGALLTVKGEGRSLEDQRKRIIEVENQIVEGNLEFYENLLSFFETRREKYKDIPAFKEAVKMVKLQQRAIAQYQEFSLEMENQFKGQQGVA